MSGTGAPCGVWRAPAPLWEPALQDPNLERFQQPAILRFKTPDQFKQALQPKGLSWTDQPALVVQPESRKHEAAGWEAYEEYIRHLDELCLYLPAQGRLYVVAADLVSLIPGAPVPTDAKVTYGFVVRLLAPLLADSETDPSDRYCYAEYAWVPPPDGDAARWQPVGSGPLASGERVLPAFHRSIPDPQGGPTATSRGMFVGMPAITAAPSDSPPPAGLPPLTPPPGPPWITSAGQPALEIFLSDKFAVFEAAVLEPLRGLSNAQGDQRRALATWVMISLANYLVVWLPTIWQRITHGGGELPVVLQEGAEALTWVWERRLRLLEGTLQMPDAVAAWLRDDLAPELANFVTNMLWALAVARGIPGVALPDRELNWRDYYCIRPVRTLTLGTGSSGYQVGPPSRPFRMSTFDNDCAPQRGA